MGQTRLFLFQSERNMPLLEIRGFPGDSVVKNIAANTGDTKFDPGSRKIPHAVEQLSWCATTIEPVLSTRGWNYRAHIPNYRSPRA